MGTPTHDNIGDSAIAYAEILFIKKNIKNIELKELTVSEVKANKKLTFRIISKKGLICGHGGGNFGNLWYGEECFRYRFIDALKNNPIIIFPQTVFFTNDNEGQIAMEKSKEHYETHRNITIVARERVSFDLLNSLYHNPTKLLTPDIVLSTTAKDYGVSISKRKGGLLIFRDDLEQSLLDSDKSKIFNFLNSMALQYRLTDMYTEETVNKENRKEIVRKKMQEFADSEFVITDRLHGMVFSAIAETPCIVFDNNHHKVRGTYEWISYLPYVKFANNVEEAISYLPELIKMKNCFFDNKPLQKEFEILAKEIKKHVD